MNFLPRKRAVRKAALFLCLFFIGVDFALAQPMRFTIEKVDLYRYALLQYNQIAQDLFVGRGEYLETLCDELVQNCQNKKILTAIKQAIVKANTAAQFATAMVDLQQGVGRSRLFGRDDAMPSFRDDAMPSFRDDTMPSFRDDTMVSSRDAPRLDRGGQTNKDIQHIAISPQWLRLLFYRSKNKGYQSLASNTEFFLSVTGQSNPEEELKANIKAAENEPSFSCVFPARFKFLQQKGLLSKHHQSSCPALRAFRKNLSHDTVRVVFASYDLNFPASSFGHTFLLFSNKNRSKLTATTVSYAADMQTQAMSQLVKGLNGSYPGTIQITPYYNKLKGYLHDENRSLYEIPLTLSQKQSDNLVDVIWELKQANFLYYFFTKNCAYLILALLDSIDPSLQLVQSTSLHLTPLDSLKIMAAHHLLADKLTKRVSYAQQFEEAISKQPLKSQQTIKSVATEFGASELTNKLVIASEGSERSNLSDKSFSPPLSTSENQLALTYLNQLITLDKLPRRPAWQRRHELLLGLEKADATRQENHWQRSEKLSALIETHNSYRAQAQVGLAEKQFASRYDFRFAFHGQTDPGAEIFGRGSSIEALSLSVKQQGQHLYLEQLNLVEVDAKIPINRFFQPVSKRFAVGFSSWYGQHQHDAMPFFQMGRGYTVQQGPAQLSISASPTLSLQSYDGVAPSIVLPLQATLHFEGGAHQGQLNYTKLPTLLGHNAVHSILEASYQYTINSQLQLTGTLQQRTGDFASSLGGYIGLARFF